MYMNVEINVECMAHHSTLVLNVVLNIDPTARFSKLKFLNAELNVYPMARFSKCLLY